MQNHTSIIPHYPLLEKIQLTAIPLQKEVLVTQSMLKWIASNFHQQDGAPYTGWMLALDDITSKEKQLRSLISLTLTAKKTESLLQEVMSHILTFSPFKEIQKALMLLHVSFKELPIIEVDLQFLSLEADLFENKELLTNLIRYTDKLSEIQNHLFALKEIILKERLDHLTL